MCSRYSLTSPVEAVRRLFKFENEVEAFPPRYNIAPTDPVHIVRVAPSGRRELLLVRWGLIPAWVKDPRSFSTLINARSEGAAEKPSFRSAYRYRRCLVPTDGFYEWTGKPGAKQPHLIRLKTHDLFALAGLWETWLGADGSELDSMVILTTAANGDLQHIHERMPVIIEPADHELWLDGSGSPAATEAAGKLLRPYREGLLEAMAVNRKLNDARLEGPELQAPAIGRLL